ncbi:MAG: molybdopterin molybdenumtransferase MoeA [Rhodanobacter sp.]|nr:MAG: molybdopterin molybdenumtransferase MoeA [Rhodanobacter sp.]TAM10435.1 MAG: molybdopterin molybdenumtransferase MoeA [Rhodanobacter sp.]TAM36733.1 MAG: molybdopterin molybdenumtransferase MoeA [Rhodanobacter sp.]
MSDGLLDPEAALRLILAACVALPAEDVAPDAALGRVLAEAVIAPETLPPFDNSAMDGYALAGGSAPLPAGSEWMITGEQAAGDGIAQGGAGAISIMTGARVPDGLDRVIPLEQTERLDAPPRVRLKAAVAAGDNLRRAGSDVAQGEAVLAARTLLATNHLMLLAALGVARVRVAARPRVAVLCTGRELVDAVNVALTPGQIRNSNGPYLAAALPRAGAALVYRETVGDTVEPFLAALARAREAGARVLLSTGAVSMGQYDFVPEALERLGAQVIFHKLAIRPGKPLLFARLPDGTLFFGLPGNPMAVAVGLRFFVEPALRAMLGLPREMPWRVPLAADYVKKSRLRFHLKARVAMDPQGRLGAWVLDGQESYRIRSLAAANAWVVIPAEVNALCAGDLVDVYGPGHLASPNTSGSTA